MQENGLSWSLLIAVFVIHAAPATESEQSKREVVADLKITIMSTMLADRGIGEWGFAALVEVDGTRILFDTGYRPDTVAINAQELGIDLTTVNEVVLSHNHRDHTGGLTTLRERTREANGDALATAHVGHGIFWDRPRTTMPATRQAFEGLGGRFIEHTEPAEIHPGVWLSGNVPRVNPETNYPVRDDRIVESPDGTIPDTIPESMALVIVTEKGLVVVSGCGHAGLINILDHATEFTGEDRIHAVLGGFHLASASDEHLSWTAQNLAEHGVENFIGAHCTGLEPVYRFRDLTRLSRSSSVVGAVGATFSLSDGLQPGYIAR